MNRALITLATDGFVNWVELPDGQRKSLSVCSPLKFVVELASNVSTARRVLDAFNEGQPALFSVDLDRMEDVIRPPRRRWGAKPFMDSEGRTSETLMSNFSRVFKATRGTEQALKAWSAKASTDKTLENRTASERFVALDEERRAFYSSLSCLFKTVKAYLTTADDDGSLETQESDPDETSDKEASLRYDTLTANADAAQAIIEKMTSVQERIETIKNARFDSIRAKSEVHSVVTKVAGILENVDLTQHWVTEDLQKLASRADHLHGLFCPAK